MPKIALASNEASLNLTCDAAGVYSAEITGVNSPYELAYLAAKGLAGKLRFAGQLRCRYYSVLHHTYLVGSTAEALGLSNDVVRQSYLHDIGEAFFVDIPSPFKTPQDNSRERAILDAFETIFGSEIDDTIDPIIKSIDKVAAIVEASVMAYGWGWVTKERLNYTAKESNIHRVMSEILRTSDWLKPFTPYNQIIEINQTALEVLVNDYPNKLLKLEAF